ncbi:MULTISPECIES: Ig-like domain-containing protein [unclassified Moorena]|uniref:Ig-like domain-containing protein n=1 Tax=unclassified Moorena TaxID=2683338 RepID=UPI0013FF1C10|nr:MULTISPECIES: Ig-like domain-containing protein [unclassified Moorena]NEO14029.1 tandem-95 repeat protein [Moorena sp. SIO3E8]NEQ00504.1 tandem-95 repeat protein [Moorena sp. SIO3F7]
MPRFEFEDPRFTLTNFIVIDNIFADNTVINLPDPDSTGTATTTFDLPSGTYEVILNASDETDGNSTVDVTIGNETFSLTLNNPNANAGILPTADAFRDITVTNSIFIPEGAQITISGQSNAQEFLRLDYIDFNLINEVPVAVDDSVSTGGNPDVTIDVLANDSDTEGDALTVTIDQQGGNGTAVVNQDGTITYTPVNGFSGTDSFTYQIDDGTNPAVTATVEVDVTAVNEPPVATDDTATTAANTAVDINVLANDTDPEGDALNVAIDQQGGNGEAVVNQDGTITYTPVDGFTGTDSFTYQIDDGTNPAVTATVNVDVTAVNEPPVATDDTATTPANTAVDINVLANDTDPEGDALNVAIDQQGGNGTAVVNQDGTITYTPVDGFTGTDTFTYQIDDGTNPAVTATVEVDVTAVNEPPVATDDTATTAANTAVDINVLANDTDPEGDALNVAIDQQGGNGEAVVNQDGTITYTPVDGFTGTDSFTYQIDDGTNPAVTATVNVDVTAVNEPPVATDDTATTPANTAVDINVLANDTDPEGDALNVAIDQQGGNGTAVVNQDGTITYTPNDGFLGADSFTYQVSDGINPAVTATVNVDVTAVNDSPVATDDTATTEQNTAVNINVLANDSDPEGDALTVTLDQQGGNGTAVVNQDGTITYTPNDGFLGADSFTYQVSDGINPAVTATVNVDVTNVNESPIATDDSTTTAANTAVDINVLTNDLDPEGDALNVAIDQQGANGTAVVNFDGTITYTPVDGFTGVDSFTYQISDGSNPAVTATVNVDVTAPNQSPVATDDTATTVENTAVDINVLANDSDPEGDAVNLAIGQQGGNGTAVVNQDGTITYTPNADFTGADSFTYQIDDGSNPAVTATVNVDVTAANESPVAADDTATTVENTGVDINVLANDVDPDGDALTVTINEQGLNGTVTVNQDSTITYTPNNGFIGFDRFTYQIDDGTNPAVTATVNLEVTRVNESPVVTNTNNNSATTGANTPVTLDVLANYSDPDGDPLTFAIVSNPSNGTAAVNDNGTPNDATDDFIIYTPNADFTGTDSLTFEVSDGSGGINTDTVNFTIEQTTPTTPLTQNANNSFMVNGDTLRFTLTGRELGEVSEIGAFVTDDAQGTIDGIAPGQSGYVEAALFRAETIFSVLPDSLGSAQPTRIIDTFNPDDNVVFYVIQGGSVDGVLAGQDSTSNVFFSDPSLNSDGQNHLQVTDNGNGQLTLAFEDGNDFDYNDATVVVSDGTGSTAPLGTGPNDIQGILELIDLTDVTGTVTGSLVVNSEAEFNNTVGWYVVDNFSGTVNGLNPGDAGYAEAAISNQVNLSAGVSGGVILAPFLISDGTAAEFLANNPSNADQEDSDLNAYFAYVGANPDQVDHLRLVGDNTFAWEDEFGGGDKDFNDVVVQVNLFA